MILHYNIAFANDTSPAPPSSLLGHVPYKPGNATKGEEQMLTDRKVILKSKPCS